MVIALMSLPGIDDAQLVVYEKSARHHHKNDNDADLSTDFKLKFFAETDSLGIRIRIKDELPTGSATVDVAVLYQWDRPATPEDDLDGFARTTGIPQVLSCASTLLIEAAEAVSGSRVPFHGVHAVERIINQFDHRKTSLSEELARSIERDAKENAAESGNV